MLCRLLIILVLAGPAARACEEYTELGRPDKEKVEDIFARKCATCHSGPWLNLSKWPFYTDRTSDPQEMMDGFMERIEMEGWGRMPPVNAPPLTPAEIQTVKRWVDNGLPGR